MSRFKAMRDYQIKTVQELVRDCTRITGKEFGVRWITDTYCTIFIEGGEKYKESDISVDFKGCHYEIRDRVGKVFDPNKYLDVIEDYFIKSILHG